MFDIIFLDLDNVIYDTNTALSVYFPDIDIKGATLKGEENMDFLDLIPEYHYDRIVNRLSSEFWSTLPMLHYATSLYYHCEQISKEIFFLSSSYRHPLAAMGKYQAVHRDFNAGRNLILAKDKYLLAAKGRLLIDDKYWNVAAFTENGGEGYLWPSIYLNDNPLPGFKSFLSGRFPNNSKKL